MMSSCRTKEYIEPIKKKKKKKRKEKKEGRYRVYTLHA